MPVPFSTADLLRTLVRAVRRPGAPLRDRSLPRAVMSQGIVRFGGVGEIGCSYGRRVVVTGRQTRGIAPATGRTNDVPKGVSKEKLMQFRPLENTLIETPADRNFFDGIALDDPQRPTYDFLVCKRDGQYIIDQIALDPPLTV